MNGSALAGRAVAYTATGRDEKVSSDNPLGRTRAMNAPTAAPPDATPTAATPGPGSSPRWLLDHARQVTSQGGEDGILEKVFEVIGDTDGWCVEFGAWDGKNFSNTYNLIQSRGYSAVLIEGSTARFQDLKKTFADNPKVVPVNTFVGYGPDDNLDAILAKTAIPKNFDVLSIDIDGNDYHVWEAVRAYRPKVVVIEFNPTIATPLEYVQPRDPSVMHGSSLLSLAKLGRAKGYELVCVTRLNGIFVDRQYFPRFGIADNSPAALRADESDVTYVFHTYDGQFLMAGRRTMLWHDVPISESRLQQLPRWCRGWPDGYGPARRLASRIYFRLRRRWAAGR